jgi:site-specific DNA-methyltransferase (adenine-specific)
MNYQILQGDNRDSLKSIPDNSIDAIITDPPYGIDFLGKTWDANTGALETYQECLRVLKPGGHILAFSAARTYHHLAVTLEQAGFEIRDQIMWIYSSGFPKSQDIGKQIERTEKKRANAKSGDKWENADGGTGVNTTTCRTCNKNNVMIGSFFKCDKEVCDMRERLKPAQNEWSGWGTALKPAHEPIALARKPIKGSIRENCRRYGTGALNIDATRVPYADDDTLEEWKQRYPDVANGSTETHANFNPELQGQKKKINKPKGARASMQTGAPQFQGSETDTTNKEVTWEASQIGRFPSNVIGEIDGYQKYFYCPKVSRRERHIGFDTTIIKHDERHKERTNNEYFIKSKTTDGVAEGYRPQDKGGNNHPTVKPIELMKYLIRLITPPGGRVLDPFNGSGSTGCAAVELGHPYIGCELDPNYVAIAKTRIEAWYQHTQPKIDPTVEELFDCPDFYQIFSSKYPSDSTR